MDTIDVIARDYLVKVTEKTRADDVYRNGQSDRVFLFGGKPIQGISRSGRQYLVHLAHGNTVHVDPWFEFETWELTPKA